MKVIVISGPTASGKTDLAIELAKEFHGEVVNFDSLLLYKELNIGTAKPTMIERSGVPHHMIDVASIASPLNASDYAREALVLMKELFSRGIIPIVAGGSGFYLQALLKGMYDSPTTSAQILERSNLLYEQEGIAPFREILHSHDPVSYQRYHENDHYRIRRAVEHFWNTGTPLSSVREKKDQENTELKADNVHGWHVLHLYLNLPKPEHLQIIQQRTDRMLKAGLQAEVEDLLKSGFTGEEKPLQSIGYKEMLDLISGEFKNLEECRERIIISTRQLAKSQRTWFNRIAEKQIFHPLKDRVQIKTLVRDFLN